MSDFHQTGEIATLHALDADGVERLEEELERYGKAHPLALVLPALYSEFESGAMQRIRSELAHARYVRQVVLALGRADETQFEEARQFLSGLPQEVTVIWLSSPRVERIFELLDSNDLFTGEEGKGRACWLAIGYVLASGVCHLIALHDCDVVTYDRRLLARLCYPIANPNLGFDFCKGYYARVTDRLYGRVTRLFVGPLVRSLLSLIPDLAFLRYLDSFRYPLAGEFAMTAELARATRVPADWGLEVGILAEVYRNRSLNRICQADLTDRYEHKHQCLSPENSSRGLLRMTSDIAKTLFRTIASEGVVFTEPMFRALEVRYIRIAEDTISRYYADARLNGLEFDRHCEEQAVAVFARSIRSAGECYIEDPLGQPLIPNWNRVLSAVPNFCELLLDAVCADNQPQALRAA